jgi:hypothetical protein
MAAREEMHSGCDPGRGRGRRWDWLRSGVEFLRAFVDSGGRATHHRHAHRHLRWPRLPARPDRSARVFPQDPRLGTGRGRMRAAKQQPRVHGWRLSVQDHLSPPHETDHGPLLGRVAVRALARTRHRARLAICHGRRGLSLPARYSNSRKARAGQGPAGNGPFPTVGVGGAAPSIRVDALCSIRRLRPIICNATQAVKASRISSTMPRFHSGTA